VKEVARRRERIEEFQKVDLWEARTYIDIKKKIDSEWLGKCRQGRSDLKKRDRGIKSVRSSRPCRESLLKGVRAGRK